MGQDNLHWIGKKKLLLKQSSGLWVEIWQEWGAMEKSWDKLSF